MENRRILLSEPLAVGFTVDNTMEYADAAWDILYVAYNSRSEKLKVNLHAGNWQILADKQSSFRWKASREISGKALVEPSGVLIPGQQAGGKQET